MMKLPPLLASLLAYVVSAVLLYWLMPFVTWVVAPPYPDWALLLAYAVMATLMGEWLGLPSWWRWIQLVVPFLMALMLQIAIPGWILGLVLVSMALIFWNVLVDRVPLYLTNKTTVKALIEFMNAKKLTRMVDLGCGTGHVLKLLSWRLRQQHPTQTFRFLGVESSPVMAWVSRWNTRQDVCIQIAQKNLWRTNLEQMDLVYVFLSPQPMPRLWQKALAEMSDDAWLVSNSFQAVVWDGDADVVISDRTYYERQSFVKPTEVWQLEDDRQTQLYCYRMGDYR